MTYIAAITGPVPSRQDTPEEFETNSDQLFGQLPEFQTQANALRDEVNTMRDDAEAKRAATATLKDETTVVKAAAEVARDAALSYRDTTNTYRGQAETARDQAQTAAAAAASGAGLPSLVGNAGKVLKVAASETGVEFDTAAGFDSIITHTSGTSGTWPATAKRVRIRMVGPGGSGCKSSGASSGLGGAAGGYCEAAFDVVGGEAYSYAIGAGGAAVTSSGEGNDGGTTSLTYGGVTYTAGGGKGAATTSVSATKGIGGTFANADIGVRGTHSMPLVVAVGAGSPSVLGAGGVILSSTELVAAGPGGGGSGTFLSGTVHQAGGNGIIYIEVYT